MIVQPRRNQPAGFDGRRQTHRRRRQSRAGRQRAVFRHPDLAQYQEEQEDDPIEAEAHKRGLTYVRLDGDIGIIGNGAGLVMTTLDVVQREGGTPGELPRHRRRRQSRDSNHGD